MVFASLLLLRRSPVLLRLPPYLSALCVVIGLAWLFILPLNQYSRQTYISENAILPGQVHTYFGDSEHNVFRAYRQEVFHLAQQSDADRIAGLVGILRDNGLKTAEQTYQYRVAGEEMAGTNVYALLKGPRADATEAMVLIAAWRNFDGELNYSGVALALALARYFKRWSVWSKDIIVLLPADSVYGPKAWVSAYHHTPPAPSLSYNVSALPLKAGALQAAVALDYPAGPWGRRFDKLDIIYDGINGALPNLDLLNTAISVAGGQMGIGCSLHGLTDHSDSYRDRLLTISRGLLSQAAGHATGPHSAFMPYHIDAITLKTLGDGWHDEMSLGRTAESLFRSVNNLLEHLHQSFFFYVLLNANRFVSIGNYLPAAMLVAGGSTIAALGLWLRSGSVQEVGRGQTRALPVEMEKVDVGGAIALIPTAAAQVVERKTFLPALVVLLVHLAGSVPLYLLNHTSKNSLPLTLYVITGISFFIPPLLALFLTRTLRISSAQLCLLQSASLLLLGAALSTLATLNFSLAFLVGILTSPLNFIRPVQGLQLSSPVKLAVDIPVVIVYEALSPTFVLWALVRYWNVDVPWGLAEMAKGWGAQGVWTGAVVWGLWWPAWVVAGVVAFSRVGVD